MKLLFKCHFFINAGDKVVAVHSMRKGKVYLYRKLPPTVLVPSHGPFSSNWVLIECYLTSPSILGSMKSSGQIHFNGWDRV